MRHSILRWLVLVLAALGSGCGGGEVSPPVGAMTVPGWMSVDRDARAVTLKITAGKTAVNKHWNFNGYYNGNCAFTVPEGYRVTIEFGNNDPQSGHSIGVDARTGQYPLSFSAPVPVFAGGISPNPTSETRSTRKGERVTVTFTAERAGIYSLICYNAGHAASGMWVWFIVSAMGKAGVQREGR